MMHLNDKYSFLFTHSLPTNRDIGERAKKYNSDIFIDITNCAAWAFNLDKEPVTKVAFVGGRF